MEANQASRRLLQVELASEVVPVKVVFVGILLELVAFA